MKKLLVILLLVMLVTTACEKRISPSNGFSNSQNNYKEPVAEDCNIFGRADDYGIKPLSRGEKIELIKMIRRLAGVKYVWGGQDEMGIDCSGLIVWAYEKLGYIGFRKNDEAVFDVTSNEMFLFNVEMSKSLTSMSEFDDYESGDFIFYDINNDGRIDHVAIFMYYDRETETVWVWDASTNEKSVAYRPVKDILTKHAKIGKPLMLRE